MAATTVPELDVRLIRAMREGAAALPGDLELLRGYLRLIDWLLAEKAGEIESTWRHACAAGAEVETLHALEAVVAERAIGVRAASIAGIRHKFEIWRTLAAGAEGEDLSTAANRLVLSIADDFAEFERSRG